MKAIIVPDHVTREQIEETAAYLGFSVEFIDACLNPTTPTVVFDKNSDGSVFECCSACGVVVKDSRDPQISGHCGCDPRSPRPLKYGDANHTKDSDCTLDKNGVCTGCSVFHGDPCQGMVYDDPTMNLVTCLGRGFHVKGCEFSDEESTPDCIDCDEMFTCTVCEEGCTCKRPASVRCEAHSCADCQRSFGPDARCRCR